MYAVETMMDDMIKIKFSDGAFGDTPVGIFRLWYRTSDNERMQIQPEDVGIVRVSVPYIDKNDYPQTLTLSLKLTYNVSNSVPSETIDEIRSRASLMYYSQNRMITASDYNVFPYAISSDVKKVRAISRTHSGHSRYIDINDPTGATQNVSVHANDGIIYKDEYIKRIPTSSLSALSTDQIIKRYVEPLLLDAGADNFFYDTFSKAINAANGNSFLVVAEHKIRWVTKPSTTVSNTGYMIPSVEYVKGQDFVNEGRARVIGVSILPAPWKYITEKSLLEFQHPESSKSLFVSVEDVHSNGVPVDWEFGSIRLSAPVPDGYILTKFYPAYRRILSFEERLLIADQIQQQNNFGLGYDYKSRSYRIITSSNINTTSEFSLLWADGAYSLSGSNADPSWILSFEFMSSSTPNASRYEIGARTLEYKFESDKEVRFFFVNKSAVVDPVTNTSSSDEIAIHSSNTSHRSPISSVSVEESPFNLVTAPYITVQSDGIGRNAEIAAVMGLSNPGLLLTTGEYPAVTGSPLMDGFSSHSNKLTTGTSINGTVGYMKLVGGTFRNPSDTRNRPAIVSALLRPAPVTTNGNPVKEVYSMVIESPGWGYATPPVIEFEEIGGWLDGSTLVSGGTGYVVGDVIEIVGGFVHTVGARFKVTSVDINGAISTFTVENVGNYSTTPSTVNMPTTAVTGTGTGALFNVSWYVGIGEATTDGAALMFVNDIVVVKPGYWYGPNTTASEPFNLESTLKLTPHLRDQYPISTEIRFNLAPAAVEEDGFVDPKKVILTFTDYDRSGIPDNPNIFDMVVSDTKLVFETYTEHDGYTYYRYNRELSFDPATLTSSGNNLTTSDDTIKDASGTVIATYSENLERFAAVSDDTEYRVYTGRAFSHNNPLTFVWKHYAPRDHRIDPSITNLIDIVVLTKTYHDRVQRWITSDSSPLSFPQAPTTQELREQLKTLEDFKAMSDQLIYRSVEFRPLFGSRAEPNLRARFKVVKSATTKLTDNEIKTRVIRAINAFFDVSLWQMGESFFYTELAAYIHQQTASVLSSVVVVPEGPESRFGNLFQVQGNPHEMFVNVATVADVDIVLDLTEQVLRA